MRILTRLWGEDKGGWIGHEPGGHAAGHPETGSHHSDGGTDTSAKRMLNPETG